MAVCPRWLGFFCFVFHGFHELVTLLSETNYAVCQSSSLSNRLCCCGSLEGRSFILLSTRICPWGSCSSVAESVPLLCLFISPRTSSGCVSACGGVGQIEIESVSLLVCRNHRKCAGSSAWFMCVGACACTYTGIAACAVSTTRLVSVLHTHHAHGL